MRDEWEQLAALHQGYFTTAHARDAGFGRRELAAGLRCGDLMRIRRGAYAPAQEHRRRTPEQRHALLCRAVLERLGANVALSHQSASTVYGHDQWGWDMSTVHVTRLDGSTGRVEAGVQHHRAQVDEADLVERDGLLTFAEDRVVVESAVELGTERGLCIVDSSLRRGAVSRASLVSRAESIPDWPGSRSARLAVRLGDGRAATVGETRSRYLLWRGGVSPAELQWEVRDAAGHLVATTDFGWPDAGHVGEFDGRRKYERDLRPGEEAADAVFREKVREDRIRDCGLGMSRWSWSDLAPERQLATVQRVKDAVERSRRRRAA